MNRNKMNPTVSRLDSSALWSKKRQRGQDHLLPSTSNSPHSRSSQHSAPSIKSTSSKQNLYSNDDDDFIQLENKKQKRKGKLVNNPNDNIINNRYNNNDNHNHNSNSSTNNSNGFKSQGSSTRSDYKPYPHDKSDFQYTRRSNSTTQKSHISPTDRDFARFSGTSLARQKQPSPLSRKRPTYATDLSCPPSSTRPRLLKTATKQPTESPSRPSLSLSTLKAQQKSPSASKQDTLILPTRHKPFETPEPTAHEDIHKIKKQRISNPTPQALVLPGKRRSKKEGPSISSNVLVLPGKHQAKRATASSFTPLPDLADNAAFAMDHMKVECPYCHAELDLSQSETLVLAYDEIKLKDNRYENKVLDEEAVSFYHYDSSSGSRSKRRIRRPVSNIDQFAFCQLHVAELEIKPKCDKNGWPTTILFGTLKARIYNLRHELDLVISKRVASTYRDTALKAYESHGKHKARSTVVMMSRFESVLPGYYGTKGAAVIQEHLASLYLHNGQLTKDIAAPQSPMEYLQHVLTPEVGFRLIREDLIEKDPSQRHNPDIDLEAKRVMAESSSFGSYLQPMDWDDDVLSEDDDEDALDRPGNDFDDNLSNHGSQTIYELTDDDDSNSDQKSQTIYDLVESDDDETADDDEMTDDNDETPIQRKPISNMINTQRNPLHSLVHNMHTKDTVILLDD